MAGTNLTRAEAAARSALLEVRSYEIDLDLTTGPDTYRSTTVLRFSAREPGAATFADLIAPAVHSITLNGRPLDPATAYRDSRILLTDLAAENELRVVADCAYMNTGEGLHRTVDPADGRVYNYTHFEVPNARRVFTSFEQPDLKGCFTFTVTAPAGWVVLSNSPTPEPEPAGADVSGDRQVWRFAPTPRISTYLAAVVAGEYHLVRDTYTAPSGQVIPLGVACRTSMAEHLDAEEILTVTKQGFGWFIDRFRRPYPFSTYHQVFVPEYNIGAMENAGCVTFTEAYVFRSKVTDARHQARAETILHEMAHMWFGDLVTMRWWDDLWLKESFATYVSNLCLVEATRWPRAWTTFANDDKAWAFRQDQLPSTHPIVADIRDLADVEVNFDGITYAKGAAVLKQLVAWVGVDAFFAGVRDYFDRHEWGSATLADLLAALAGASGRDLSAWSRDWLQSAGPNTLRPEYTLDPSGAYTSFAVLQEAPAEHPTLRPHRIAIGQYKRGADGLRRVDRVELDVVGARTEVPQLVGAARPDVLLLNDDDLTYALIRLDPYSLDTVVEAVAEFTDSLPRALCWAAAWDMVRSAELAPRAYLRMVLAGIGRESNIGMVETLHRNLVLLLERFVDPPFAAQATRLVADAAWQQLKASPPGSDFQISWARLYARVVRDNADLDRVAGLLADTVTVDGLAVDTELRWALLAALVRHGRAGEPEIAAEQDRDRTTAGAEYAAGARAAQPSAAAKEAAWASIVDSADLPNGTQEAVMGGVFSSIGVGLVQTGQPDLLAGFVERYFAAVGELWASRTGEIGRNLVVGLYPRWQVAPETVDRTDRYLDEAAPPPALRRLLLEGRDDVVRALRARAADRVADDGPDGTGQKESESQPQQGQPEADR